MRKAAFGLFAFSPRFAPARRLHLASGFKGFNPNPRAYSAPDMSANDISYDQVAALVPQAVMKHFAQIMQTPRPSGEPARMVKLLRDFAAEHKFEVDQDEVGNIKISKPASPGLEAVKPIILQCHIDMVCTKSPGIEHNFSTDPIRPQLAGDWLKAKGTTLGADNGLGVASVLAILQDPKLKHGPVHGLFTVEEETTMEGAELLQGPPFLPASAILVNVDSEEQNAICVGCAGGAEVQLKVPLHRAEEPAAAVLVELRLRDLLGGHSGIDIQFQRGNAIKILADVLETDVLAKLPSAQVVAFDGGNAPNAIPSYATAQILVSADEEKQVEAVVAEALARQKEIHVGPQYAGVEIPELGELPSFAIDIVGAPVVGGLPKPLDKESAARFLSLVRVAPNGVWRLSKVVNGQTDTSLNMGISAFSAADSEATIHFLIRSFSEAGSSEVAKAIEDLAALSGVKFVPPFSAFRGWEPRADSPALHLTQDAFARIQPLASGAARVYSIHAGLECGMLLNQYPQWDCVSIGPLITGAHSVDEQLKMSTVGPFYSWLQAIVSGVGVVEKKEE